MACPQQTAPVTQGSVLRRREVQSSLQLDFQHDMAEGRTVLAGSRQEPPWRVVRGFRLADGAVLVHLHNVSGGLLGGDRLHLAVTVGRSARAQITTTGATRIYRPRHAAPETVQLNEIAVAEDGLLEYVPDPIIPFAQSRFYQRTVIRLAAGAGLFWWDALAPGREAGGEVFAYEQVRMSCELWAQGCLIAAEAARVQPDTRPVHSPARLGAYRYWASFYMCRVGLEQQFWVKAEQQLREAASALARPEEMLLSISTLPAHGLSVRCLARHSYVLIPSLQKLWCVGKLIIYGGSAIFPRKVN